MHTARSAGRRGAESDCELGRVAEGWVGVRDQRHLFIRRETHRREIQPLHKTQHQHVSSRFCARRWQRSTASRRGQCTGCVGGVPGGGRAARRRTPAPPGTDPHTAAGHPAHPHPLTSPRRREKETLCKSLGRRTRKGMNADLVPLSDAVRMAEVSSARIHRPGSNASGSSQ